MSRFARRHFRARKKEIAAVSGGAYRIREKQVIMIAAVVVLALLGSFVKGVLIGRWLTKR